MNHWLAIPGELRLGLLALVGAAAGAAINLGTDRLAWNVRHVSPWLRPAAQPPGSWPSRLPVLGWLWLRQEHASHGRGFWIRPLVVELAMAVGLPALYYWETIAQGLLPPGPLRGPAAEAALVAPFIAHAVLLVLMLVASLIDLDEKTIPDGITLPGTLLALVLAAVLPQSHLPIVEPVAGAPRLVALHLASPAAWPPQLAGSPERFSLAVGLACYWGWCLAILPRVWRPRRGMRWAMRIFWGRLVREPYSKLVALLAVSGPLAIAATWHAGGPAWRGLLTALVGLAASGGLVWAVRLIGAAVLRREAMGFGDVTLMAMIGAFLGWQCGILVFFLSPFCGLILGALQWILHRESEIPFGPFLCLAAALVVVRWPAWWDWASGVFALGWAVPLVLGGCLGMLALLLALLQLVRGLLSGRSGGG